MNLKKISLLCVIFLLANFCFRTVTTIFNQLDYYISLPLITYFFSLLSGVFIVVFFFKLQREFRQQNNRKLVNAVFWPIITSILVFIYEFGSFLAIFLRFYLTTLPSYVWSSILPLIYSISVIYFLVILYKLSRDQIPELGNAALSGVIGYGIGAALHTAFLIHTSLFKVIPGLFRLGRETMFVMLPILLISILFIVYFFYFLYRHTDKITYLQEL